MNKYTEELEEARRGAGNSYRASYSDSAWYSARASYLASASARASYSASDSASDSASYWVSARGSEKELEFQISKTLELLDE